MDWCYLWEGLEAETFASDLSGFVIKPAVLRPDDCAESVLHIEYAASLNLGSGIELSVS